MSRFTLDWTLVMDALRRFGIEPESQPWLVGPDGAAWLSDDSEFAVLWQASTDTVARLPIIMHAAHMWAAGPSFIKGKLDVGGGLHAHIVFPDGASARMHEVADREWDFDGQIIVHRGVHA